ncbi:MAG: hypothetical protein KU28_03980 [Sulfurovum sp. PC08-66]|nr:MAG: hypothetical protein KU28_03980 [Sulfurovum sp. PC08-66]
MKKNSTKIFLTPKFSLLAYMARNIHTIENEILKESNESLKYYKLASLNPRNQLNRANQSAQLHEVPRRPKRCTQRIPNAIR